MARADWLFGPFAFPHQLLLLPGKLHMFELAAACVSGAIRTKKYSLIICYE
jgi:hypothetical protein